ncbi:MAG: hypothetical protein K9M75_13205 [Phycisphaerae bacterium]|nr:hypothetical protein [Phycisphaerae bacterium]
MLIFIVGVPYPLGWMTLRESKKYVIGEHWDGTRTIYMRVRFDQFNSSSGKFELFNRKVLKCSDE